MLAGGAAAAALGPLAGCGGGEPLRIAVQPWCGYQFLLLGRDQGWIPPGEARLVETGSTRESVEALAGGRVDGAALTLDEVLLLRERGVDVCVVMVFDFSAGADVVLAVPGLDTPAALAGRRIGVEDSALGAIMLDALLRSSGLQRADLTVVPIGEDHFAAWQREALDAVITYAPSLGRLEALGLRRIFDSRKVPQLIVDTLVVRTDRLRRHHDALHALTAAHFRALGLWFDNPIDTAQRLAPRLGIPAAEVKALYSGLDLPDAPYNLHLLSPPAAELNGAASAIGGILLGKGMLLRPPSLQGLFSADCIGLQGP